jgi:DNA-binding transcriptional LysR family regulator
MRHSVVNLATIDLNDVAVFARVVETGSFTRAAAQLGLPKSAVSRKLARLEEALGVRLLQRSTRRLSLTEAGARYHAEAATALAALSEAAEQVTELQDEPAGRVRITAPPDLAYDYLTEPIASFCRRYPKIRVELLLTARIVDLVAEGVDFALRAGGLRDSSLVARRITTSRQVMFATRGYLARRGVPREPEDLEQHDCVLFRPENGKNKWTLRGPRGERTVTVTGPVAADDVRFVGQLTASGLGIGRVPTLICPDHPDRDLVRVLPEWDSAGGALSLVHAPTRHVPQRVQLLREHLFEELKKALPS